MGQDITCLITDKNIELDKNIVHFKVRGFTFIPFETSASWGIEMAKDFDLLSNYILYLESEHHLNDCRYNRNGDHFDLDIFKMVKDYQIENFIIEHHYEWADIPVDYCFMQVADGAITKNSLVYDESEYSKGNWAHVQESKTNFGLNFDWLAMTDLFYSYFHSERFYFQQQIMKGSNL
ncbi:hypothetical protein CLU96_2619 [Chryseobacterium sp. 52]|uniref:hypothetical protein n=1 Tax=Chryseobacterium sp. 52 TaxID=2035213 RepID=UPI000C184B48|nr:hypothetical protein [Chryseobacterium sp. 52]PIF45610.1 hypothetical protein CLU96_2619 [Chryseobacterium sp. 52]